MALSPEVRKAIREAYEAGTLQVDSVDAATGKVFRAVVADVLRHRTPHKPLVRVEVDTGQWVECTKDHSLFGRDAEGQIVPVEAGTLQPGASIVVVKDGQAVDVQVISYEEGAPAEFTFDLAVPGPENFVLSNGILAHNSYSCGGISLDLEKSSKYESIKQNAESQFDKATEAKARTTKYVRGLKQQRFGMGVRSSFGPATGHGILSPRSFTGG